ncbi:phage tail tape measure protein [Bacteroides sp. GM023]|uniref:phage tail tape measure protein n=1 Tax=Bacteroides sp. GM023 TaxID=2723058 RepID=UPI00168A4925|nr:phage tail tape measure protein [Bacteroides sp. GM023]MBD3589575.1 phage tail tape measure protein [Bacteroides sp. GM023]
MSLKIDRVQLEIVIQQDSARQKMIELEEKMRSANKTLNAVKKQFGENSAEYKAQNNVVKALKAEYDKLFEKVGIGSLSLKELQNRQKELNAILRNLPGNSPLYTQYKAQLDEVNQRMKELKGTAESTKISLSKLTDGFNKYAAIGASVIASLTGITMTARKCVDEFAQMQEAESQVRKYTGMTSEQVADLNKEFKKIDTRTARERLNDLAGDAGRLGITAKKEVLEFVEAANMIDVALGEDLGQDAIKNIGKLADMFGDSERSMKENMLAIGSAVNEVAQNSSAAEPYLVEFSARMGGVAKQAKLSITNVMGFASALDQNMLRSEMASTALQGLILKLYQEPAKYAKLAKLDVEQFTKLMQTDANEAILQFLGSLGKLGGMDKMAPVLKAMKLSGAEAAGVISALASNVEKVRKEQDTANQAFRDGTSITNEYNVQNTTVQAELDKAKIRFKEIRIELGERLLPVMKYMVSTGSLTVKGLIEVISFFGEYKNTILTAIIAIVSYNAAMKLQWFWTNKVKTETGEYIIIQKLKQYWDKAVAASTWLYIAATSALTGKTRQAGLAMQAFFNILKLNPFASIATLVISVAGALYLFSRRTSEAHRAQLLMNSVMNDAKSNIAAEKTEVESLLKIAKDETALKGERLKAIEKLNKISPEYLGALKLETIATDEAKKSVDEYVQSLLTMAEIESVKSRLTDTDKQLDEMKSKQQEYLRERNSFLGALKTLPRNIGSMLTFGAVETSGDKLNADIEELQQKREQLKNLLEGMIKDKIAIETENAVEGDNGKCPICGNNPCTCDTKSDKKPWTTRLQNAENAHKEELLLLRKSSDALARTENEYQLDALQKELKFQVEKLAIIKKYQSSEKDKKHLAELGKMESETQTAIYNTLKKSEDTRLDLIKEYRDRRLNTISTGEKNLQLEQSKLNANGELTEKDYKNRLLTIEITSLYSRLEVAKDFQNDVSELEFQNGEVKAKALKEAGDNILYLEQQINEKRAKIIRDSVTQIQGFNNQFNKTNGLTSTEEQLSALKTFYHSQLDLAKKNGLDVTMLTAVYEEAKRKIEVQGAKDRAAVVQKYGLETAENTKNLKLKALEEEHQKGLLSEEEYEIAKNKINNDYIQKKIEGSEQYFNAVSNIMSSASSAVQGFQDAEMSKVTSKYDKEIKAAKKAGKDTTKLEEEKEEALNQVKKKYADKQFAVSVLQITASTAVAAMEAYKAMAGIPIVGPALGAIAAAAAVASGAAQIAVAKQQRDEAKGLKSGGYSDEYVEGYTRTGNPDDVAGVIPVHKNEFVTNHEGVANPHVRQFLDVFNVAQKNGTIRMLNTTQILEQVRTRSGKYSGGYSEESSTASSSVYSVSGHIMDEDTLRKLFILLNTNNDLLQAILEKDLIVDSRAVRDGLKKLERMEKNVSRG